MLPALGCGDGEGRLSARYHLAQPGNTVDHPDPACTNKTAEGYPRPHVAVCARLVSSPALIAAPLAPATAAALSPQPTPMSNSPAPISPRVSRNLEYEGYVKMSGRTRGETRALRDASREYAHRHGLTSDNATMVSMLAKDESAKEIVRQHSASKDSPDLPTAHASDLYTPNNVYDVEKSPHADI